METTDNPSALLTVQNATLRNPIEDWLRDAIAPNNSPAGVPVNGDTVRGLPAAWYSISKIAGHIGVLPLNLYRRLPDEMAEIARNHPAYYVIKKRPNEFSSPAVFRETIHHHALLHGNGRAAIIRNGRGDPIELIPMLPSSWAIVVSEPREIDGIMVPQMKWHVRIDDPSIKIKDENVLHIMGLSNDGIGGISLVEAMRTAFGIAVGQQRQRGYAVKNGAKIRYLLSAPPGAFRTAAEAQAFIDGFNSYHSGADNVDKVGLLREGITAQAIGQSAQQAQELEHAIFGRQDVALAFGIESMLGDKSSNSYNTREQAARDYLVNCLQRWMTRWEEECGVKLLTTQQYDSDEYYFKFVPEALLRGTTKERYEVYQIARQIGVMSANEVRELEDMNERTDPGGDSYDNPAITVPGQQPAPPPDTEDDSPDESIDTPALAKLRRMVTASVRGLVQVEITRVHQATGKPNFCKWLDEFYAGWSLKIQEIADNCDHRETIGAEWCQASKSALLDVAGKTDQRGLGEAVRAELAKFSARADELIETLLGA
jgi:HK97 family phage portal protein